MHRDLNLGRIIIYITYFLIGLAEVLLILRFILEFLGANGAAPFAMWVYDSTDILLLPFRGLFPIERLTKTFVIDFSTLFAVLVYGFLSYIVEGVINYTDRRRA